MGLILLYGLWRTEPRYRWIKFAFLIWIGMFLLSTPLASNGLLGTLESKYPEKSKLPEQVDAIIVMGGGMIPPDNQETETLLTHHSRERCRQAMRLFKKYDHPKIILCGSKIEEAPGETEAEAMRQYLISQGIPKDYLLIEDESSSSYETIRNVTLLIEKLKAKNILLVTHASHLYRTILCCQKQGLKVTPSGCCYRTQKNWMPWYTDILPSTGGFSRSSQAIYEWMGIAWYQVTGKI